MRLSPVHDMAGYVLNRMGLAGHSVLIARLLGIIFCYSCHISVHNLTENAQNHTVTQHSHYALMAYNSLAIPPLCRSILSVYIGLLHEALTGCCLPLLQVFCFTFSPPFSLFFVCSSSKFSISKQLPFEGKRIFELCIGCLEQAKVDWLQPGGN